MRKNFPGSNAPALPTYFCLCPQNYLYRTQKLFEYVLPHPTPPDSVQKKAQEKLPHTFQVGPPNTLLENV